MLNKRKELRSGASVWTSHPLPKVPFSELTKDIKTEIAIIGAGITGSMIAEELAASGYEVAIFDRREPLFGSTLASTALLQYDIDVPLVKLKKQIGAKNAEAAWQRSKLGLDNLINKIRQLKIKCSLETHDSLYIAGNLLSAQELKKECDARNSIGLHTEYLSRKDLKDNYGIVRAAALKTSGNITVDPVKMAAGFLKKAIEDGAKIYSPVNVSEVTAGKNEVVITTSYNHKITAKYVIFSTGYEIPKYIPKRNLKIFSTWAIATKPQKKLWPGECMIWEASDPYLYIRSTKDGRVICGGEDEEFVSEKKRDKLLGTKSKKLQKKLATLFPYLDNKIEFSWTGSFGSSNDGLPRIGRIPNMKNCFAILAFGGNGITFARIAAEIISAEISGKKDKSAKLYTFN